ncbi:MAG: M56 family metallopeptidase [Acidobacteriota bacterium]
MPLPIHESSLAWDQAAVAWLLTYLIHSTLLLFAAWLLSRIPQLGCCQLKETLWKAALLGGVLTASLQAVPGFQPLVGRLQIAWLNAPVFANQPDRQGQHLKFIPSGRLQAPWRLEFKNIPYHESPRLHWMRPSPQPFPPREEAALSVPLAPLPEGFVGLPHAEVLRLPDPSRMAVHVSLAESDPGMSRASLVLYLWAAGAGLLLLRLAGMKILLQQRLRGRKEVPASRMAAILERLCRQAGLVRRVRLTFSDRISGPMVLGRCEVCVPFRAEQSLQSEQQESLLAHELAHIVRRDSRWLLGSALLERLFFFQPLNWVARRRLQEEAEYLCDDWAVGQTGQGVDLARCLAQVACWIDSRPDPLLAPGMADRPSIFVSRVRRLCRQDPRPAQMRRWKRVAAAAALLASVSFLAPVVSAASPALVWTSSQGKFLILRMRSDDIPHTSDALPQRKVFRL